MQTLLRFWRNCRRAIEGGAVGLIILYQRLISPVFMALGVGCRFYPSCSKYALASIEQHGLKRSVFPVLRRLSRCHPWCAGGLDPVAPKINPKYFSSQQQRQFHG